MVDDGHIPGNVSWTDSGELWQSLGQTSSWQNTCDKLQLLEEGSQALPAEA